VQLHSSEEKEKGCKDLADQLTAEKAKQILAY
jgi:hypothetical protein